MPEELLAIAAFFTTIVIVVKLSLDYKTAKLKAFRGSDQSSLGTSELKALIREAVREGNAPLESRIEELEALLKEDAPLKLPPAGSKQHLLPVETAGPDRPHLA